MPDYWITTHWPTPSVEPGQSRHVFVKEHNASLPKDKDIVFFRESKSVRVNGRTVHAATRHHLRKETKFDLPKGKGGIIGTAIVAGDKRKQVPEDVLFDFGDLREWSVVPCRGYEEAFLSLDALLAILGRKNPRFLSLWRMPDEALAIRLWKSLQR
jgi:hypothetical protein